MRRALGWLLPGQPSRGPLSSFSAAAPAWLQHAVDAAASVSGAAADARGFATRPELPGDQATAGPSHQSLHDSQAAEQWHAYGPSQHFSGSAAAGLAERGGALQARPASAGIHQHTSSSSSSPSSWAASSSPSPSSSAFSPGLNDASAGASASCLDASGLRTDAAAAATAPGPSSLPSPEELLPPLPHLSHLSTLPPSSPLSADPLLPFCADPAALAAATAAFAPAEQSALMQVVQQVAMAYEFVHSASGLPWAASIPLTTLALRLALLPLSMRQARIIRTNYAIYKEAVTLTDAQEKEHQEKLEQEQQQQRQQQAASTSSSTAGSSSSGAEPRRDLMEPSSSSPAELTASPSSSSSQSPAELLHAKLLRSQAVLSNFHLLRRKCDAPHPVWIVVNPLVQIPVFVAASATLGMMCRAPWPGLSREGALWFPDLTLPAYVMDSGEMPLGLAGFVLPLLVYAMTMTSLRLGFGASGLAGAAAQQPAAPGAPAPSGGLADTALGAFLRSLPPLLYAATTANLYFKVQMAHGVLMHWVGSAGFTLSLQLALRNPTLRGLLGINRPGGSASGSSGSSSGAPGSGSDPKAALPTDLVARVAETTDANVLVIMGAQLSARHHYAGALHCLKKAVLLNPSNVRAHYSMGQVYSLTDAWSDAELSYRAAAELAPSGPERGQALYCVATALHAQGKLEEAAEAYGEADQHWLGQTVIAYGRANALAAAGRREEALAALAEAEERDNAMPTRPFKQALGRLRERLVPTGEAAGAQAAGGGDAGRQQGEAR